MSGRNLTRVKKDADKWFSLYIRHRDGHEISGEWVVSCITCGVAKPIKEMQNGHFIRRSINHLRYDEQNCNAQCPKCNIFNHGELYLYSIKLDQKYGEGTAQKLHQEASQFKRFTIEELHDIIETSKRKIADLTSA